MKTARRDSVSQLDLGPRRLAARQRTGAFGLALLFGMCALVLSLWVPGFHHHAAGSQGADCAVCLTVAAQSWDLPITAATLPAPPPAEARSLIERTPPSVADAPDDSEAPRGPPLT